MQITKHKQAFTLIELLVVVLIIGILAAVAMPQYQKAIIRSQLTQAMVLFNTYQKGIEMWVLENGLPANTVYFTGDETSSSYNHSSLNIDVTRTHDNSINDIFNENIYLTALCRSQGCSVAIHGHGDKKWLNGCGLVWQFYGAGVWKLARFTKDSANNKAGENECVEVKKVFCQTWKEMGREFLTNASSQCATVGINV